MAYLKPQAPLMNGADYIYPITTADQVVMDDGNRLSAVGVYLTYPDEADSTEVIGNNADTLGGIAASQYALKTDIPESNTFGMDLLWSNASPSSSFAAQTISLNLSSYTHVMIEYRRYASSSHTFNGIYTVNGYLAIMFTIYAADGGYKIDAASRNMTVKSTGIVFEGGKGTNIQDGTSSNNSYCVPIKIFGLKGVNV